MSKNTSSKSKRIAKNTLALYFRMVLTMAVSLYTSRVVLSTIGVIDYGIYNAVGGVIGMFAFLSNSLSGAITRFMNFEMGKGNDEKLNAIFSTSINIQIIISIIVLIIAETAGVWFLNNKMVIPDERMYAANWVLQCSILTFMVNMISIPYNASIIAHEHMKAFAYVSIVEVTLKLGVVFLLMLTGLDKLVAYSILLLLVAIIIRMFYGWYCTKHFEECHYHRIFDRELTKEMFGFAGWNFIGSFSGVLRSQGVNIVINLFCGPVVNAARAVSNQVHNAINQFTSSFTTAVNPQITQSYACGDIDYCINLLIKGTRLSFYLLLLMSLPIILEADFILSIWLKDVPEHSSMFVRLTLLLAMVSVLSGTLVRLILSTGDIKNYQLVVGGITLANLPIDYCLMKWLSMPAEGTIVVAIIIEFIAFFFRLFMANKVIPLSIKGFLSRVLWNVVIVSLCAIALPSILCFLLPISATRFFIVCVTCLVSSALSICFVGCTKNERQIIVSKVLSFKNKHC